MGEAIASTMSDFYKSTLVGLSRHILLTEAAQVANAFFQRIQDEVRGNPP